MKKIKILILLMILFNIFTVVLKAEDHESANEESQSAHHETETPMLYYLNWAGLIAMCVIVLGEIKSKKSVKDHQKDKKEHEFYEAGSEAPDDLEHKHKKPVFKPLLVILIAGFIFFGEYIPVLFSFHESLAPGYFRIIFKIIIGILLLSYGLAGMEEEHH